MPDSSRPVFRADRVMADRSTERMPVPKAVIFDFFGTLVPVLSLTGHKTVLRGMAERIGAPAEDFVQQWLATFSARVTGRYPSVRANIAAICETLSVPLDPTFCEKAVALRYAYVRRSVVPRPSAIPTLQSLKAQGLKIGLITDCSCELPEIWKETAFAAWFDATIFSSVVGIKKPNAAIYRLAAERLGVSCADCVYVGDGGSNELTGAKAVGMRPVLLLVSEEQGSQDTHRMDGQAWDGPCVTELSELCSLITSQDRNG